MKSLIPSTYKLKDGELGKTIVTKLLLVTDLDHTLVGDDFALERLNQWVLQARPQGTQFVYCTGRSLTLYRELQAEAGLIDPDLLICSVGTEIYLQGQDTPDPEWSAKLALDWNRAAIAAITVHFADLVPQPETEQCPFKLSFFLTSDAATEVLPLLESQLAAQQLAAQLIYSSGKDLDILPIVANKGAAMTFIRQKLEFAPEQTVVCGDSGNDIALFEVGQERGIIVGNARSELLLWHRNHPGETNYLAKGHCAAGILEGLEYFGFLQSETTLTR
jgi:sucrose-6-phosphatase